MLRLPRFREPRAFRPAKCCPCHANTHSDAQNAAPATTSAMASPKCCACHDFASPEPRARQHPSPLDSCQMLPLPRKHTLRCTECCACHDFGNGISKVLRLPRCREPRAARTTTSQPFRQLPNAAPAHKHTLRCTECCACHDVGNGISKVLRLPRFREPRAARATTSQPFRQLPNAAPATQTHTQMHRMLRLPRLRQWHLQSAAPATFSRARSRARQWHLQSAAHSDAQNTAPATTSAMASPKCCACHDFASHEPRARQHPSPLDSCQMLPLPRKHTLRCTECCACHDFGNGIFSLLRLPRFRKPRAARATTSQPFRQLPNAAPADKHTLRCTECCACHDFGNGISKVLRLPRFREPRAARATTSQPLDSCQMLPLPRKHTLRCTECCACHDFGNGISKVLRLPRFRKPRAARATTPQPFKQLPNAAPVGE